MNWIGRTLLALALLMIPPPSTEAKGRGLEAPDPGTGSTVPMSSRTDKAARARIIDAFRSLPMRFEANLGQDEEQGRFLARGSGYQFKLRSTEAVMVLRPPAGPRTTIVDQLAARPAGRGERTSQVPAVSQARIGKATVIRPHTGLSGIVPCYSYHNSIAQIVWAQVGCLVSRWAMTVDGVIEIDRRSTRTMLDATGHSCRARWTPAATDPIVTLGHPTP